MDRLLEINPILRFELIRTARQRRHYALRAVLALIPLYAIWVHVVNDWIGIGHPNEAARYLWQVSTAALFYPPNLAWAWSGFLKAFPVFIATQVSCSIIFLVLAALCLRPLRLGLWRAGRRERATSSRPVMGDDPMMWKELYSSARRHRTMDRLTAALFGVLLFCPLID